MTLTDTQKELFQELVFQTIIPAIQTISVDTDNESREVDFEQEALKYIVEEIQSNYTIESESKLLKRFNEIIAEIENEELQEVDDINIDVLKDVAALINKTS